MRRFVPAICSERTLLFLVVLLAWLPSIGRYTFVMDDYYLQTFAANGVIDAITTLYQKSGLWRILALTFISCTLQYPAAFTTLIIVIHSAVTILAFETSLHLHARRSVALVSSLILATMPFSHQSMWWAPAFHNALSTLMLLLSCYLFAVRYPRQEKQLEGFIVGGLIAIIATLCFEGVAFAMMVSGSIAWLQSEGSAKRLIGRIRSHYAPFGPTIGAALVLIGIKLTQPPTPWKAIQINPESIFSAIWYQWCGIRVFEPLAESAGRRFAFWELNPMHFGAALILVTTVVLFLLFGNLRETNEDEIMPPRVSVILYCIVLLVSLAAVYGLGGGYSLDARKRYPFVPVISWIVSLVISRCLKRPDPAVSPFEQIVCRISCLGVIFIGTLTTWTVIGIISYELARYGKLVAYLEEQNFSGTLKIESDVDPHKLWPHLGNEIGHRLISSDGLGYRFGSRVTVTDSDDADLSLRYDRQTWHRD